MVNAKSAKTKAESVFFRATEAEVELWKTVAEAEGLSLSAWLRKLANDEAYEAMTGKPKPTIDELLAAARKNVGRPKPRRKS